MLTGSVRELEEIMKKLLFDDIENQADRLIEMADIIFDNPETGGEEKVAAGLLAGYLENHGFTVETGLAGLDTAFRGSWQNGMGGPVIGLLCEYDALEDLGHGCGHHMQGPACLGAAVALKNLFRDKPYRLVVYGTPAEETFGGKINLMKAGYLKELDAALMMHGAPDTCTDMKCLALSSFDVIYHGKSAHAAICPEEGRSAFDAMLLTFQGVEFLREHVRDDVRMHYTLRQLPGPENVVPEVSAGRFALRSFSREYLDQVIKRFMDVVQGAALMAGVSYEMEEQPPLDNKVPVTILNNLLVENAREAGAPGIRPPRERTGSTDFGNVMHEVPGSCIRVKFVPEGTSSHSQAYIDAGKTKEAHDCVLYGAKAMAGTVLDLLQQDGLLEAVKEEFKKNREIYK